MKLQTLNLLVLLLVFLVSGCDTTTPNGESDLLIYSNSFDTREDVNVLGYGAQFSTEVPSGGGAGSAFISGGCTVPHTNQTLTVPLDGFLRLRAWGKEKIMQGGIELRNLRTDETVHIIVEGDSWKRLESQDMLKVKKGDKLELTMSSGGFVPGGMLVTQVDVALID